MELRREDIIRVQTNPYQKFMDSLDSSPKATRKSYINKMKKICCEYLKSVLDGDPSLIEKQRKELKTKKLNGRKRTFYDADFETRLNEFVKKGKQDPDWVETCMIKIVSEMGKRSKLDKSDPNHFKASSIQNYLNPVVRLFELNKIRISWKSIYSYIPDKEALEDTRGYEVSEIRKMLQFCPPMEKVIVLLDASSGIRAGAFDLKWGDIFPIYKHENRFVWEPKDLTESVTDQLVCGMVKIYSGTRDEYFAFFTPECWQAIQFYKQTWIDEVKHYPRDTDPLFKQNRLLLRKLSPDGVRHRLDRVVRKAGIRKKLGSSNELFDIPIFNGFRRFFNKQNKRALSSNSPLAALILKENMMGHNGLIKLDRNYFKAHIEELIDEYVNAIPHLTISEEDQLRAKNQQQELEVQKIKKLESENNDLRHINSTLTDLTVYGRQELEKLLERAKEYDERAANFGKKIAELEHNSNNLKMFIANNPTLAKFLEEYSKKSE